MRLTKGAKIVVEIPVVFLNEDECPGLKEGGTLNVARHTVEMSVLPDNMPESIEVDLTKFEMGATIHMSEANPLTEGAEPTITDRDFTIATIMEPRGAADEDEDADAEAPETEVTAQGGEDAAEGGSEES
ncbi:UNVERIFIED_CONTAM: hypothetical protein GTU68_062553 [Idotea baltica]|nr:hypothetical protein [Idotea baltica]